MLLRYSIFLDIQEEFKLPFSLGQKDIEIVPIITVKLLLCCTCELRYAILIWYFTLSTKSSFLPSEEPVRIDEKLV